MLSPGPSREGILKNSELLSHLREGDHEAWRALSAMYRQRLRELAASKLPAEMTSRVDASDVVQETLAEANESFAAFQGRSMPELFAWLAAILNHNVTDAVRGHLLAQCRTVSSECNSDGPSSSGGRWEQTCVADQTSPSMAAARGEAQERLRQALDSLPPRQRTAVRMRHLEGRTLVDIAAELSCTTPAAAALISRGLRSLRDVLPDLDHQAPTEHAPRA
ncbi:MAG: sigma-70 family RNA polymerase sigma factor [Pirellulales bacterium]